MALTATQRFDAICPEFKGSASKAAFLEMSEEMTAPVSATGWDEGKRASAVALRAAHMITLSLSAERAGGAGGQVTQKREGDLAVSFGGSSSRNTAISDLDQTAFGIQLQALVRGSFMLLDTTGGDDVFDY